MQVPVLNTAGEETERIELRDDIFGLTPNVPLMHQALQRQLANARLGTHDTKTRGEVSGGGKKPFRQKGTGRARQGSTRAPHWKGGGIVFGPTPRSYEQRMPKQMRRLALKSALSAKAADNQIRVVEPYGQDGAPKTKEMLRLLGAWAINSTALIVLPQADPWVAKSAANLQGVKTLRSSYLNVRDLLQYDYLILSREAIKAIEGLLGNPE